MANDQSIELRVSLQERQMETAVEIVEEIRANYVTKADFRAAMAEQRADFNASLATQRTEFKEALAEQRSDFKEGLGGLRVDVKEYIDQLLTHYATKEDLAKTITYSRNWVITVGISLAALQFTMQMVFFQWYTHLR